MNAITHKRRKNNLGLMALEPRWMFDGAAMADAAHAAPDASAKALIPDAPAPVQVRAADPSQDSGKKEVVFVDTSVAGYQTLEAAVKSGIEIEEIDGSRSGLAQMAKWAETHTGYDSISVLSHGAEASVNLGADTLSGASLSSAVVQAELAQIGHALNVGGDLLLYGCDVAKGDDGQQFIDQLAAATGANVAASDDITGIDGNWTLEKATGAAVAADQLDPTALVAFGRDLSAPSPFQIVVENPSNTNPYVTIYDSAVDSQRNIYVVGSFNGSITFSVSGQTVTLSDTFSDYKNVGYIAKYDSSGACLWAEALAGATNSSTTSGCFGVAVDSSDNVIVGGSFQGTAKFDPATAGHNATSPSSNRNCIFVTKLDSSGAYVWNNTYGTVGINDSLYGVAVAGTKIALVGEFGNSVNFGGTTLADLQGGSAGYVVSLNADGTTAWGYTYDDTTASTQQHVYSVKSDGTNFYVVGKASANDTINSHPGGVTTGLTASVGTFLQKLDAAGSSQWFETVTTANVNLQNSTMAVDANGDVIVVGIYSNTVNFDPTGTHNLTSAGSGNNIFVAKYSGTDGSYSWAESIGGTGNMGGYGVAVTADGNNNVYVGGTTDSSAMNIDPAGGAGGAVTGLGASSFFADKLDSFGTFIWGKTGTSTGQINVTGMIYDNGITGLVGSTAANITSITSPGTAITKTSYKAGYVEGFGTNGTPYSGGGGGGGGGGGATTPTDQHTSPPVAQPIPVTVTPQPVTPPTVVEPPQTVVRDTQPPQVFAPLPPTFDAPKGPATPITGDAPRAPAGEGAVVAGPTVALTPIVAPPTIIVPLTGGLTATPTDGGFRVAVFSPPPGGGGTVDGLVAIRPEVQVPLTDGPLKIAIPADAFAHSRADAVVTVTAARVNGQPLPSWLNFDSRSGTLTGQPPADMKGTMIVRIIARDDKGQEATITIRINGLPEKSGAVETGKVIKLGQLHRDKAVGKIAFTQQLKLAARNAAIRFS